MHVWVLFLFSWFFFVCLFCCCCFFKLVCFTSACVHKPPQMGTSVWKLYLPVVLTTRSPLSGSYNSHTVSLPSSSPAPITQMLGWLLAMVCGIVIVISVHNDPSPPHTPHASYTLPPLQTPHWKKWFLNLELRQLRDTKYGTLVEATRRYSGWYKGILCLTFSDWRGQLPSISVS